MFLQFSIAAAAEVGSCWSSMSTGWLLSSWIWWIPLHPTAGALWPSRVLYYLFVWLGGILDGFQGMLLVFQLIVELPQFGSSITSLLIDPLAAFITHLLLLSCVHILTLDSFKDTQQQMWWWWKQLFLSPVGGSHPLFFFRPTRRLTVLLIPSDQFVVEIRNQEGRVIPFPHGLRHLWDRAVRGHFTNTLQIWDTAHNIPHHENKTHAHLYKLLWRSWSD